METNQKRFKDVGGFQVVIVLQDAESVLEGKVIKAINEQVLKVLGQIDNYFTN